MASTKNAKKGFTLIELLVVITIIGILATGGVAVYTSQIQKARDTTRLNDVEALKSGVEQYYQDKTEYPSAVSNFVSDPVKVTDYVPKLPTDPKTKQVCNGGEACDYLYAVEDDANGILNGEYKISTAFENSGNVTEKAGKDGGPEAKRYEVGLNLTHLKPTVCQRGGVVTPSYTSTLGASDMVTSFCTANPTGAIIIAK